MALLTTRPATRRAHGRRAHEEAMRDACVARGAANARATGMARATRGVEAPRCEVLSANHFLGLDTRARGARRSPSVSFTGLRWNKMSVVVVTNHSAVCIDSLMHSCCLLTSSFTSSWLKRLAGGRRRTKEGRRKEKKISFPLRRIAQSSHMRGGFPHCLWSWTSCLACRFRTSHPYRGHLRARESPRRGR